MTDQEIYRSVRTEVMAGAGGMMAMQAVIRLMDTLVARRGDEFTMDGALDTLEQVATVAEMIRDDLRKAKESKNV